MNPRRIVATLLETGEMPPEESSEQFGVQDIKDLAGDATGPRPLQGKPFHGYYNELKAKLDSSRRMRTIYRTRDRQGNGGPEGGRGVKVANNTYLLIYPDGTIAVRLHDTDVVTVKPDDTIRIDSGGWYTRTSQDRIGEWIRGGWNLYTLKGEWHWYNYANPDWAKVSVDGFKMLQPANSGDTIDGDGVLHPTEPAKLLKVRKPRVQA